MALPPYNKSYLDIDAQVALIQQRGLVVTDEQAAKDCLNRIGYYRLSGYWHVSRKTNISLENGRLKVSYLDEFQEGSKFSDVLELYVFDKKLRLILLDAIERIEIALRVNIALTLGSRDRVAHRNPGQLHTNFSTKTDPKNGKTNYRNWLDKYDENERRSKEDFVTHFRKSYSSPIPIWIAIELWDFGLLSKFLSGMKYNDQQIIANKYGSPRPDLLLSWARSINFLRNTCAHHGRVWNIVPVDQPKVSQLGEIALLDHLSDNRNAQERLYGIVAPMQLLMRTINPSSEWCKRLHEHMATLPLAPGVKLSATGFPEDWDKLPLWNSPKST